MIRIVGYGRESTREQAEEGFNLDEQQRRIREYVDLYYEGQEIQFSMIREEGASARSLDRPQMKIILNQIQNGHIDVLIIHNLDRLTRKVTDMHKLLDLFEENRVQLVSLKEHVDTATPQGRLFISIIVLIAQWEEETIADRTVRGMMESARQGNYAKPKIPLGYYRDPDHKGKLLIDEEQAEVIRTIFTSIAAGSHTPFTIARKFRSENVLGRRWTDATVLAIVQNKAYFGTFEWHEEMYTDHVPAIVDKELWEEANAMVQSRGFRTHSYLFKDLVRCRDCGSVSAVTCTTKKSGAVYHYYSCPTCRGYMNEDRILSSAAPSINEMIVSHHIYEELRSLNRRKNKLEQEIRQLDYDRRNHDLDQMYYEELLNIHTEELVDIRKEIGIRKARIENLSYRSLTNQEIDDLVHRYVDHITVDYKGHLAEIGFNDEYRRILRHVF